MAIKSHETGTTTDPRLVEEIVRYLKNEYGVSDISIIESDGSQVLADVRAPDMITDSNNGLLVDPKMRRV